LLKFPEYKKSKFPEYKKSKFPEYKKSKFLIFSYNINMASSSFPISSPVEIVGSVANPSTIYLSNSANSVVLKAPAGLTGNVDFTFPNVVGLDTYFLQRTGPTSTGWSNVIQHNPNSSLPLSARFNTPNGDPASVSSTTFVVLSSIVYRGTATDNVITQILAVVETSSINAIGQVQVFDFTNNNIIATSNVFFSVSKVIVNLGVISNLPIGQAILEIQLRRENNTGGGNAAIHSIELYG
jgi:hypothetical protein